MSDEEKTLIRQMPQVSSQSDTQSWVAPLLFDLQVNGYGGIDFQRDDLTADDLLTATERLRKDGCGKFLLTLITAKWDVLLNRLQRAKTLRDSSSFLQRAIAGWHIEGPFLSDQPGFHGAHDPSLMLDPTPERIYQLREMTGNDPLLLTLAPERDGALQAIELAVSLGIKINLGHTNASATRLAKATAAGATGFTHLGNGCPCDLDRHDNILWRVLDRPGLTVSLIPDKVHVSPSLFRLVHRLVAPGSIVYTTDAMAAAGCPPGRFTIGKTMVEVGEDQIVREPGKTNFAGSALRPVDGVFRAAEMLGCPWQDAWIRASQTPEKFLGLTLGRSEFCVLTLNRENELTGLRIISDSEAE